MNLIVLHEHDRVRGDTFVLRDERALHVIEVLRCEVGGTLRVGLIEGPCATGFIIRIEDGAVELELRDISPAPARPLVDLVLAIPRPKSLRKLLPEVAALGVDRIILLRTWRVAKPYLTADVLDPKAYRPLLIDGLMQARRTHEPRVMVEPLFKPFVEDRARSLFADATVRLVAHPVAAKSLATVRVGVHDRVVVAVGPEGGFLPYEVEAFEGAGFEAVSMGPHPLRVETACVALLAQLALLRELCAD